MATCFTSCLFAAVMAMPLVSRAGVVVTTTNGLGADTYLSDDGQTGQGPASTHGTETGFQHRVYSGVRMKVLYLRFNKPTNLINYASSTLKINFTGANRSRTCTVYGLNDGDVGETWDESSVSYSNAPGIVWTSGTALASYPLIDSNRMTALGTWQWQNVTGQQTSDPSTLNLAPFLAADKDGLVTFLFVTTSDSAQSYFGTCKEAANGLEPVLTMPNAVVDPGFSNLVWAVGNGVWDITNSANWNNGVGSAVYQETNGIGSRVQFDDTATGTSPITITLDMQVQPRSITNNSTKDYTITGVGSIAGSTGVTKEGSGTLTLSTYNPFVGAVNINGGVLQEGYFGALGDTTGGANAPINFNGGTLKFASGIPDDVSVHQMTFNAGGATIDTSDNMMSFANPVGHGGSGSLTKKGSGTLTLSGGTAYTGNTYVQEGILAVGTTISNSPAIVVSSGAVLDLNGVFSPPFRLDSSVSQSLSGNGTVDGLISVTNGTFVSPGGDGVVGTLTISNTFGSGGFQLNGGTLNFDISTTSSDLIVDEGTLDLNSGSVHLNVTGTLTNGTYKLMTYAGIESGSAASIAVTGFSQAGQIAFMSDATPGQIDLVVASQGSTALVWKGDGAANLWDVESTANWLSNGVAAVFLQGDSVTFDNSGSTTPAVNLTGALFPSAVTVNATTDYTLSTTTGGRISGSTGLTKDGSGMLTILTDNNNTGPVTVNSGTLQIGDGFTPSHIGNGGFTNNSTVVFFQANNRTVGAMRGTGSVVQQGSATLTVAGEASYTGPTTVSSGTLRLGNGGNTGPLMTSTITNNGALVLDTASSYTYSGPITGFGGLTKNGAGTVTLNGNNTETGDLTVSGGTLVAGNSQVIKSGAGLGNVVVNGGASLAGTLDINGMDESLNGLNGAAGTVAGQVINNGASGTTNTLTIGNADAAGDTSAGINNGTAVIKVVKTGAGIQILRAASTYSGGTTVAGGELDIQNNTAAGTGLITVNDGATLNVLAGGGNSTFPGNDVFVPAGATAKINSSALGNGMGGHFISGDSSSTLEVIGPLSWGNPNDLQFSNFTGRVLVDLAGTVRFSSTALGLNGGDNATFEVNGFLQTRNGTPGAGGGVHLGALSGTGTLAGPQAPPGNSTYVIGGNNMNSTFSGTIAGDVPGSANSIIKIGTGTFTINGTNLLAGSVTVSNGVLALVGEFAALSNCTAVAVSTPGSLDLAGLPSSTLYLGATTNAVAIRGNGAINGSVVIDPMSPGVTITPGFSIGVLTLTGSLSMNSNVTNIMELDTAGSPTSDRIVAAGITYGGTLILTNIGGNIFGTNTFQLFSGTLGGSFANVITQEIAGVTWDLSALNTSGTVTLIGPNVNPEPTNMVFSVSGGMLNISWPSDHTGWTLQAQTNSLNVGLSSNWADVPGSTATNAMSFSIDPANGSVFYRLKFQP